jgi:hypothetical protein
LSTSATRHTFNKRGVPKTVWVYLAVSALCFLLAKVYDIFGHGVTSNSMDLMFLYPLLGGALPALLVHLIPGTDWNRGYRVFQNCHNGGIALLTVASLQTGVFEIAGTSSTYTMFFSLAGCLMILAGLIVCIVGLSGGKARQTVPQ